MYGGLLSTPHSRPCHRCSGAYQHPSKICGVLPVQLHAWQTHVQPSGQLQSAPPTSTAAVNPSLWTFSCAQARASALHSTASTGEPAGRMDARPTASAPLPVPRSAHAPPHSSGWRCSACVCAAPYEPNLSSCRAGHQAGAAPPGQTLSAAPSPAAESGRPDPRQAWRPSSAPRCTGTGAASWEGQV